MSTPAPSENVRSALVTAAHPNIADLVSAAAVTYRMCASGKASGPTDRDATETARTRETEQRAPATPVPAREVVLRQHPDDAPTRARCGITREGGGAGILQVVDTA